RIDEDGYPGAIGMKLSNDVFQLVLMADGVPSRVGSKDMRRIRDQGGLRGPYTPDNLPKPIVRIAFNIEFSSHHIFEPHDIIVPDMSFIRSGVHGNPLGSEFFSVYRYFDHIGIVAATGVPQGSDFVYIYA